MTQTELIDLIAVGSLILTMISWVVFGFTTMRKIDKAVVATGRPRPCQWDPMWGRAFFYAWPIIFSGKSFSEFENAIVDTQIVKQNTNLFDKFLAWVLFSSNWTLIVCVVIGWVFSI